VLVVVLLLSCSSSSSSSSSALDRGGRGGLARSEYSSHSLLKPTVRLHLMRGGTGSILELSIKTRYDDAMPRLPSWVHILPLTVGILTGCTTLVTTYDRLRATLNEPETDDTIRRYGAWFLAPSNSSYSKITWFKPSKARGAWEAGQRSPVGRSSA